MLRWTSESGTPPVPPPAGQPIAAWINLERFVHDLRARHAGRITFIEFHLVVPGTMSVHDAHMICDRIEEALEREVADVQVSIHVEPEHKAKHPGVPVMTYGTGA
jgi:divalent metal cation (Fe/Co/Zn/Cd) transporter